MSAKKKYWLRLHNGDPADSDLDVMCNYPWAKSCIVYINNTATYHDFVKGMLYWDNPDHKLKIREDD